MNIHDLAHNLARELKNSKEFKEYETLYDSVYHQHNNQTMIDDFRQKMMDLQLAKASGKEVPKEEEEKLKKAQEVLMMNPDIASFFYAEMRFSQIVQDVFAILEDAIQLKK